MNWTAACALIGAAAAPDAEPVSPAASVRAAVADALRLPAAVAQHTRYLSAGHLPPAERDELYAVTSYHVNGLSREGVIVRPRRVNPWLWAVDVRDYGWDVERYGKLAYTANNVEPYYHVEPLDPKTGKVARPLIGAPWLPAPAAVTLAERTVSSVPIVRADWFLNRTAIQEGRDGFGYYDWLELKSRKDAETLAGLDRKAAERVYREQAGVIVASGVALQGRQLFRYATISGSWWESRDTKGDKAGRDERNPVRMLLDDFRHDAEEIVYTLPNGMPGFYLSDAAGKGVASAPPDIASDAKSSNNDRRVHAGMSCIRCHTAGGLIPFDDHARRLYAAGGGIALGSTDDAKFRRLKSVYLGAIERKFKADSSEFAATIKEACGLAPAALSAAFHRQWSNYLDKPVTPAMAAAECGLTPAEFAGRLKAWATTNKLVDPVIAGYLGADPIAARREHFEEAFPLLMLILGNPGAGP